MMTMKTWIKFNSKLFDYFFKQECTQHAVLPPKEGPLRRTGGGGSWAVNLGERAPRTHRSAHPRDRDGAGALFDGLVVAQSISDDGGWDSGQRDFVRRR